MKDEMMSNAIETFNYKNHEIQVFYDSNHNIDSAIGDEPVMIISFDQFGRAHKIYDGSKRSLPDGLCVIRAIECNDDESLACELNFDIWQTEKRFAFDSRYQKPRYYKTRESRHHAMLEHEGLQNVKVEAINTRDERVYIVYDQSDLDEYVGGENARPMIEAIQACFYGEVYGYTIDDSDLDSCWGFVGDLDYCVSQAKEIVDCHVERIRRSRTAKLKTLIRNHVPLQSRSDILEQLK